MAPDIPYIFEKIQLFKSTKVITDYDILLRSLSYVTLIGKNNRTDQFIKDNGFIGDIGDNWNDIIESI